MAAGRCQHLSWVGKTSLQYHEETIALWDRWLADGARHLRDAVSRSAPWPVKYRTSYAEAMSSSFIRSLSLPAQRGREGESSYVGCSTISTLYEKKSLTTKILSDTVVLKSLRRNETMRSMGEDWRVKRNCHESVLAQGIAASVLGRSERPASHVLWERRDLDDVLRSTIRRFATTRTAARLSEKFQREEGKIPPKVLKALFDDWLLSIATPGKLRATRLY